MILQFLFLHLASFLFTMRLHSYQMFSSFYLLLSHGCQERARALQISLPFCRPPSAAARQALPDSECCRRDLLPPRLHPTLSIFPPQCSSGESIQVINKSVLSGYHSFPKLKSPLSKIVPFWPHLSLLPPLLRFLQCAFWKSFSVKKSKSVWG